MAQLPECPNHVQGLCERSEIVFAGENEQNYLFICRCCKLFWAVTRSKLKQKAAAENENVRRQQRATEHDRRTSYGFPSHILASGKGK